MKLYSAFQLIMKKVNDRLSIKSFLLSIAVVLPIIVYLFQQPPHGFEYGVYIASGNRVSNDQLPYRDFFSMYGPLIPTWARIVLSFGLSPDVTERMFFLPESVFSTLTLWVTWRFFNLRSRYVLLLSIGAITIYAPLFRCLNFLMVAQLLFVTTKIEKLNKIGNCLSGVSAALSILYYQDVFVYIELSLIMTLVILTLTKNLHVSTLIRLVSLHIVGVMLILIPLVTYLSITGSLKQYLLMNWIFPARFYSSFSFLDAPHLLSLPVAKSTSVYDKYIIPVVIRWISGTVPFYLHIITASTAGFYISWLAYKKQNIDKRLLYLTFLTGLLSKLVLQTGDQIKLLMNLFVPVLVISIINETAPKRSTVKLVSSVLAVFVVINIAYVPVRTMMLRQSTTLNNNVTQLDTSDALRDFFRRRKIRRGECLLLPNLSYFYAYELNYSPTRFDYFDPIVSLRYDHDLALEIARTKPKWVVVDYDATMWDRHIGLDYGTRTISTIKQFYNQEWTYKGLVAYKSSQ